MVVVELEVEVEDVDDVDEVVDDVVVVVVDVLTSVASIPTLLAGEITIIASNIIADNSASRPNSVLKFAKSLPTTYLLTFLVPRLEYAKTTTMTIAIATTAPIKGADVPDVGPLA
jgi:hypothetical protein